MKTLSAMVRSSNFTLIRRLWKVWNGRSVKNIILGLKISVCVHMDDGL